MKLSRCGWMAVAVATKPVLSAQLVFATGSSVPAKLKQTLQRAAILSILLLTIAMMGACATSSQKPASGADAHGTVYADPAKGFSISYPDTFMVAESVAPEIFFVTDSARYPWMTVAVWKAPDFTSALKAHMNGWTSYLKFDNVGETTTHDGTKASLVKVTYVVQGWDAEGLAIGIQRGDEWAIAEYSTAPPYGVYDEANYLKTLQTLKFTK